MHMKLDQFIHGVSTLLVSTHKNGIGQGTGFFYQILSPEIPDKETQWREIRDLWLITNRHVVLAQGENKEIFPESVSFHMRKAMSNSVTWEPIVLDKSQLLERALFHPNHSIDICAIRIWDVMSKKLMNQELYVPWTAITKEDLPNSDNKLFVEPEVTDDVLIIGYPRGFYDNYNIYPIIKSGIIASKWGANFEGEPYFLIDAKLFPGSSGSLVLSKPQNLAVVDGIIRFSKKKHFCFLGIFSGEPYFEDYPIELEEMRIIRKSGFNLGMVWYGSLVEEIIKNGIAFAA